MCTISWLPTADGYELLFSRDESRRRGPASPPSRRHLDGIEVLAPTDSDFGGTWLSLNAHGWCIALLNRYQDQPTTPGPFTSRGLLVLDLASSQHLEDVEQRLQGRVMTDYRPFTLVVTGPPSPAISDARQQVPGTWQIIWDGRSLGATEAVEPPIASSGYDPQGIQAERRRVYTDLLRNGASLLDFHRSHDPSRGPFSPCMHRPDASTVSLTRVTVDRATVTMAYADGPPCRTELAAPQRLQRQDAG